MNHPDEQIAFWEKLRKANKGAPLYGVLGSEPFIMPAASVAAKQDQANEATHAKNAEQSLTAFVARVGG